MHKTLSIAAIFASLVCFSTSSMADVIYCHGEFEAICKQHPYNALELCPSSGSPAEPSTASNDTCQRYCGKDFGPGKCSITKNFEHDGNKCGYLWATVRCF